MGRVELSKLKLTSNYSCWGKPILPSFVLFTKKYGWWTLDMTNTQRLDAGIALGEAVKVTFVDPSKLEKANTSEKMCETRRAVSSQDITEWQQQLVFDKPGVLLSLSKWPSLSIWFRTWWTWGDGSFTTLNWYQWHHTEEAACHKNVICINRRWRGNSRRHKSLALFTHQEAHS